MQYQLRLLTRLLQRTSGFAFIYTEKFASEEKQRRQRAGIEGLFERLYACGFNATVQRIETPRIAVDHVAEHVLMLQKRYTMDDFCRVTPPSAATWIEWNEPRWMTGNKGCVLENPGAKVFPQLGFLLIRHGRDGASKTLPGTGIDGPQAVEIPDGIEWVVETYCFAIGAHGNLAGVAGVIPAIVFQHLRKNGSIASYHVLFPEGLTDRQPPLLLGAIDDTMPLLWFALNAMNCKNIQYQDATAVCNPPDKWLRRAKAKKLEFKTLKINGLRDMVQQRRPYNIPENAIPNALHWVRGHFKDYTEEAPLLGKHVGAYWWDQHSRGKAEHGVVVKDYEMSEPVTELPGDVREERG